MIEYLVSGGCLSILTQNKYKTAKNFEPDLKINNGCLMNMYKEKLGQNTKIHLKCFGTNFKCT